MVVFAAVVIVSDGEVTGVAVVEDCVTVEEVVEIGVLTVLDVLVVVEGVVSVGVVVNTIVVVFVVVVSGTEQPTIASAIKNITETGSNL